MLEMHKSKIILLIERDTNTSCELLKGISKFSQVYGDCVFYRLPPCYMDKHDKKGIVQQIRKWNIDGAIINVTKYEDTSLAESIINMLNYSIVFPYFDYEFSGIPHITSDPSNIGKFAFEHFRKKGFKNFGFCGFSELHWSNQRENSFKKYVLVNKCEFHCHRATGIASEDGYENICDWLMSLPKPIGILCCNDDMGQDVIEACQILGLRVPVDVAVLGIDNDEMLCTLCRVSLSSIELNTAHVGFHAMRLLTKMITQKQIIDKQLRIEPISIVPRQSTEIFAVDDSDVLKALQFIQDNIKKPLQVEDVCQHTFLSRKGLYQKFHRTLGCSVYDEIKRMRVEQIKTMLEITDLTVSQIAYELGFTSVSHIARFFSQVEKMTPSEYRKKRNNR
jgi:LacI family transcriptional regulator